MTTGDIENRIREIVTPIPTDADAPRMYLHGIYIMGAAALTAIVALGLLAGLGVTVPTELGVIAGVALSGVSRIFERRNA
jgi:hypothetical protein